MEELLEPHPPSPPLVPLGTDPKKTKKNPPATDLMKVVARKVPVKKRIAKDFTPEEAAEIQAQLQADEQEAKTQAEDQTDAAAERRALSIRVKKLARDMENGNRSRIIAFPSYSKKKEELEWYKLGNFSALYYVYRMADRMGRTAHINKDNDRFAKMNSIASIRNVDSFIERAMRLSEFDRYEKTLDGIYILYLKKPLDDDEVGILRRTEEERKNTMHNVLRPKNADPAVYQAILMIDRQVLPRVGKMERGYFNSIGNTLAKGIFKLTHIYFLFAKAYIDKNAMKSEMLSLIEELRSGVALLGEIGVWGFDIATSIGSNINSLEDAVLKVR